MTTNETMTTRQASSRLAALFAKSGVDARVKAMTGRGVSYSIRGDRVAAAKLLDELGVPFSTTEFTMFVKHEALTAAL